jgi:hypothetical protein
MNEPSIARHAWVVFIVVTVFNALAFKFRSQANIQRRPDLAVGYNQVFKGILLWGNLPWIVMGIGILFGGVQSIFSYFRPRDGNPFVLAWFGVVVGLWIVGFYWVFARRGAEFLIEHPGLLSNCPKSPAMVRLLYCFMVGGGIVGLIVLFVADIPGLTK